MLNVHAACICDLMHCVVWFRVAVWLVCCVMPQCVVLCFFQSTRLEKSSLSNHTECSLRSGRLLREDYEPSIGSRASVMIEEKRNSIGSRSPACIQRMSSIVRLYSTNVPDRHRGNFNRL